MLQPNVILSFPSVISLARRPDDGQPRRSWIQLARVGAFTSNRYGRFSITKQDLSQMLSNFENITPKAPTELPIDYDHLSMDPKKPGDGKAAGWIKNLELREDGQELWGQVEWTPDGAEHIEKQEYRFVSPSFVKDHVHKNGEKIGTTLLAAAITNHPFLEGMKALTLYNASAIGDLALLDTDAAPVIPERRRHLAEIDQRLTFADDPELTPELTPDERTLTVIVKAMVGEGDDQVVRVATMDGEVLGWFRMNQMKPADAPNKHTKENNPMPTTKPDEAVQLAMARIAEQRGIDLNTNAGAAMRLVDTEAAAPYLRQFDSGLPADREELTITKPANPFNLRRDDGETLPQFVTRVAGERCQGDQKAAYRLVYDAFPEMVNAYSRGETL